MNTIAQILGLIASVIMILSIQVKNKKNLFLALNILVKILYGVNFALLGGMSGAITQLLGLCITIIAYLYSKKDIAIPYYITFVFILATLISGIFTYTNIYSILAIGCGITYSLIVSSKSMKTIRKLNLTQAFLWTIYDLLINAYTASISSAFVFISTIISIYRYDIKKEKNL